VIGDGRTQTIALLIAGGGALGVIVWAFATLGKALVTIAEALAAAAVVFLALWLAVKAVGWHGVRRSRTGAPV
jgi:S-DNA-T family DNA segregation ATPase FtsK/SpoIIIE